MPYYRGSWYSQLPAFGWFDAGDKPGSNALGVPDDQQGIALPSRRTLGQYFNVTDPRGKTYRLQQTDIGPAKWTGRGVDISAAAAQQMGYTPKTFPTDAGFKVELEDGSAMPANATLTQGRGMPTSLVDLYGNSDQQQPSGGGGFGGMSNSLIGLGMGLLSPYNAWKGESPYANALQGFQTGSALDQRSRQQQQEMAMQRERMQLAREQAGREPEAIRQLRAAGVPQDQWKDLLYPKAIPDWREGKVTYREQDYPYRMNPRTGDYEWGPMGPPPNLQQQQQRSPAVVPGTSLYWPGQQQSAAAPAAPATTGAGGAAAAAASSDYPPDFDTWLPSAQKEFEKTRAERAAGKLSPHEQTTIEKADDAVAANRAAINILNYAKQLSPKAPSGLLAPLSDQVGQALPQYMSEETKARIELKNTVMTNAVEQLRAIFGGNPTEGERKVLIELQGSIDQPDAIRQKIFDRAIEAANRRLELNRQRAEQVRGGTYYRPGGGQGGAASSQSGGGVVRWGRDADGNPVRLGQ